MPEYNCVNIGVHDYPVWLTLSQKATIASIEPTIYADKSEYKGVHKSLVTTVTVVVDGCCCEVKSPLSVESVCRILGFVWDERDVVDKPAPAEHPGRATASEEAKPGGGLR